MHVAATVSATRLIVTKSSYKQSLAENGRRRALCCVGGVLGAPAAVAVVGARCWSLVVWGCLSCVCLSLLVGVVALLSGCGRRACRGCRACRRVLWGLSVRGGRLWCRGRRLGRWLRSWLFRLWCCCVGGCACVGCVRAGCRRRCVLARVLRCRFRRCLRRVVGRGRCGSCWGGALRRRGGGLVRGCLRGAGCRRRGRGVRCVSCVEWRAVVLCLPAVLRAGFFFRLSRKIGRRKYFEPQKKFEPYSRQGRKLPRGCLFKRFKNFEQNSRAPPP